MNQALEQSVLSLLNQVDSPYSVHDVAVQMGVLDEQVEPTMAHLAARGLIVTVEYEDDPPAYRYKENP